MDYISSTPTWVHVVILLVVLGGAWLGTKKRLERRRKAGLPPSADAQEQAQKEEPKI